MSCCLGDNQTFHFACKSLANASRILSKCQQERNLI